MIRVQQIADLEARVLRAVDLIERLRAENRTLNAELTASRERLTESQERLTESQERSRQLEEQLTELRSDQENVEQIIVRTLDKLDGLEDAWAEQPDEPLEAEQDPDAPADAAAPEQSDAAPVDEAPADEAPAVDEASADEAPGDVPAAGAAYPQPGPPDPPPSPPGAGAFAAGERPFGPGGP